MNPVEQLEAAGYVRQRKARFVWDDEARNYRQVSYDDGTFIFVRDLTERVSYLGHVGSPEPPAYRYQNVLTGRTVDGPLDEIVATATGGK